MTPSEFKAWFEGFCEGIDGAPSEEQFERIKERVEKIGLAVLPTPHKTPTRSIPMYPPQEAYWKGLPTSNCVASEGERRGTGLHNTLSENTEG